VLIANREQQEQGLPPKAQIPCSWSRGAQPSPLSGLPGGDTHPGGVGSKKSHFPAKFREATAAFV